MLENDDLTIQARLCGWDLFSPNWNFIKQIQATPLGSLCGLSVGLAPKFADPSWVFNVAMPHLNGTDTDDVFESGLDNAHVNKYQAGLLSKFIERAHVATQNLEPLGTLSPCLGSADSTNTLVRIVDFVRWAKVKGWSIPHELVEFVPEPAKHGDDCAIKLLASLPEVNSSSASDASRAGDTQASASDSNQADKEVEPDAPWIIFCKSQIDDIFQSRIASGQACGVGYLADELVARCKRKNLITKRNVKVSKDNVLKQVLMGWTAPEIE